MEWCLPVINSRQPTMQGKPCISRCAPVCPPLPYTRQYAHLPGHSCCTSGCTPACLVIPAGGITSRRCGGSPVLALPRAAGRGPGGGPWVRQSVAGSSQPPARQPCPGQGPRRCWRTARAHRWRTARCCHTVAWPHRCCSACAHEGECEGRWLEAVDF